MRLLVHLSEKAVSAKAIIPQTFVMFLVWSKGAMAKKYKVYPIKKKKNENMVKSNFSVVRISFLSFSRSSLEIK